MQSFARAIILALALATGSANINTPSVNLNLKHGKFGNGLNLDSLGGDVQVESKVSDDLSVGLNLDNSDSPLRSIFAKMNQKLGGGNVKADLTMSMGDNAISGDVTYTEGDNELQARVNSANDFVERVKYSRKGNGWTFKPTFNMKDKNMDLEASADYSADTNVNVRINAAGESHLEIQHQLDADTSVNLQGAGADVNNMRVEVSRKLDGDNTLKPAFDMASKHMTLSWERKMDQGRTMTMNLDPENSVNLEFEGASDEDWKASVSSPWGNFKDADVSVGRKFNF